MDMLDRAIQNTAYNSDKLTLEQISLQIGVGYQVLVNKLNPHSDHNKLSLRECIALMLVTDDVSILQVVAEELGHAVYPLSDGEPASDLLIAVLTTASRHGDITQTIQDSLADGIISESEHSAIHEKITDLHKALDQLAATLNEKAIGKRIRPNRE